ncbi:MAG: elongation factor P maturation arginine rhamnosyltransferase EarP [Gallionella sp.]
MQNDSNMPRSCDIFCTVIDNYGDVGVAWRLARQIANEHGLTVRLWVDDLNSFAKLCSEASVLVESQKLQDVEVIQWRKDFHQVQPAELVIEAFACKLPEVYIVAMAALTPQPVWINLEYLSAENWVETHHKLPSPHATLPVTKHFFFPGFTQQTGGLLLECDLLVQRDSFLDDKGQQALFWRSIGLEKPPEDTLKISMFCYENAALEELFDTWGKSEQPILCLVPEGRIVQQVEKYFADAAPSVGKSYSRGSLRVCILPFAEQERYDELLWACDVNFVRGEDSFVRAQWAGKPFIWQIYPQDDAVHMDKLQAYMDQYCALLGASTCTALRDFWLIWNKASTEGQATSVDLEDAWSTLMEERGELENHAKQWVGQLSGNNLALNLLDFSRETGKIRGFKKEGP